MPNKPLPPLNPGTLEPIGPEALAPLFPMELIKQEVSPEKWIDIPDEVRNIYSMWRPTPLFRAYNFEKALDTPAKIYYKYEGVSPTGSHKPNTAVAQAYYNKQEGVKKITTETGAGQWGSALSFACQHFGIDCEVFMVKLSYEHKGMTQIKGNRIEHQLGIYRSYKSRNPGPDPTQIIYYDEIRYAKSCKNLKLDDLGYSCKDIESQNLK